MLVMAQNNCIHMITIFHPWVTFFFLFVPVFHVSHLSVFYLCNSVYSVDAKGLLDHSSCDCSIFSAGTGSHSGVFLKEHVFHVSHHFLNG